MVQLTPHVEYHKVTGDHGAIATVIVGGEHAPRPQGVWSRFDNRRKCETLRTAALAACLEFSFETAFIHTHTNVARCR